MLKIDDTAFDNMVEDAINTFPDECCGFLYGKEERDTRQVLEITVVDNARQGDRRRRFEIRPQDYLRAEQYAEERGLLLLGVYHSHPNHPAIPSEHDRVAAQPYFSYVILSVLDRQYAGLRSWRLDDGRQFEEEFIHDRQLI